MTTTTEVEVTPKVCIQCLASYNAGRLIFEWVDADEGLEGLIATQKLVSERAIEAAKEAGEWPVYFTEPEEFMLADWEGFPEGMIGEWTPLARVAEIAEALEEVHDRKALAAYMSLGIEGDGADITEIISGFEEANCGEYESMRDYAYYFVEEVGWAGIEGHKLAESSIGSYLDYDMIARELEQDHSEVDGYIFRST